MKAGVSAAVEVRRLPGVSWRGPTDGPGPADVWVSDGQLQQTDSDDPQTLRSSVAAAETRSRVGRRKLNDVRNELRHAELRFVAAKRSLADREACEAAGRIADALGRAIHAIDGVAKGAAVHPAVEALVGVFRFDPAARPRDFIHLAGKSVVLAGRVLARCSCDSIAYWGRMLSRLGEAFLRHEPGTAG